MGIWDEVKRAGRAYDDLVGDSYFSFNCPKCSGRTGIPGTLLKPKSQAEEIYKSTCMLECSNCRYTFGVDPYRGYVRCTCGGLCALVSGFVGIYECRCNKVFSVLRRDSSEVDFSCFKGRQKGVHLCNKFFSFDRDELQRMAKSGGTYKVGCVPQIELSMSEILKHQLPNFVDRTETAVLPLIAIHDLQRQGERQLRAQLESFAPARSTGRRITYRRIKIDSNGIIVEELVIE